MKIVLKTPWSVPAPAVHIQDSLDDIFSPQASVQVSTNGQPAQPPTVHSQVSLDNIFSPQASVQVSANDQPAQPPTVYSQVSFR